MSSSAIVRPLARYITVFSSAQRNAALGTAWWALRLRGTRDLRRLAVCIRLQWSVFRGHVSAADSVLRQIHREKTLKFASAGTSFDIVPRHPARSRSHAGLVHTLTTCQSDFNGLASISIDWRRFSTMKVSLTAEPTLAGENSRPADRAIDRLPSVQRHAALTPSLGSPLPHSRKFATL